ncbi:hypothetical protein EV126DRAFT_404361 [Verticillium dahliae]|nr:hypothetical protein EV126DRAFT_404361 [Verticillium dahliae]
MARARLFVDVRQPLPATIDFKAHQWQSDAGAEQVFPAGCRRGSTTARLRSMESLFNKARRGDAKHGRARGGVFANAASTTYGPSPALGNRNQKRADSRTDDQLAHPHMDKGRGQVYAPKTLGAPSNRLMGGISPNKPCLATPATAS